MLIMEAAPHVWAGAVAPVRVNLVKVAPEYRGCFQCGGEPLYTVTWSTPGAWWGDSHRADYCGACVTGRFRREGWVREVNVTVCDRLLSVGRVRLIPGWTDAIVGERMRLSRRAFDRGLAGDFRPYRRGGRRELLPLV